MAQFFGSVIVDVKADPIERRVSAKGDVVIPSVAVEELSKEEVVPEGEAVAESGDATEGGAGIDTGEGTVTEPVIIGNTREQTFHFALLSD